MSAAGGAGAELVAAMIEEMRELYGGLDLNAPDMPAAGAADLGPPGGTFLVGYRDGQAVCGGGIKRLGGRPRKVKAVAEQSAAPPVASKPTTDENLPASAPLLADANPAKIQKSELIISEPRRHRDKAHLKFVASQPCLVCGRSPADAHHLRFTQPRAMGRKVSDEFTVPLCRTHHRDNHSSGDEVAWWERRAIDPMATSRMLWVSTRRIE